MSLLITLFPNSYKTPLLLRGVFFTLISLFIFAQPVCSADLTAEDYSDHLSYLGQVYNRGIEFLHLRKSQREYLRNIYQRILKKSKKVFPLTNEPTFYIIKDESPFYFSLPDNSYYLSRGLIKKYIKNETTLISNLTYMMLQAHNKVFLKQVVVPVGYISTDQMISLIKLPLSMKTQLNRSVYWVMEKMGLEGSYYLQWIQLQNRNTLDFSRQIGDPQFITKEEFLFKQFISKKVNDIFGTRKIAFNSSKNFYRFLRGI